MMATLVSQLAAGTPPPGAEKLQLILGWVTWIATALCGLAFTVIGTSLALSIRRGATGEHVARLAAAAAGVVIVGVSSQIVNVLLGS
jgi:hypothetical protein